MPNITGFSGASIAGGLSSSGCFYHVVTVGGRYNGNGDDVGVIYFDASRSSSVYQDGAKVNPDNLQVAFIIKY